MNASMSPPAVSVHGESASGEGVQPGMAVDRRQFLIGPRPLLIRPDWVVRDLGDGCYLTHCPTLPVAASSDISGRPTCLLGLAVQTAAHRPSPADEIHQLEARSIEETTDTWSGRWILVTGAKLSMDASGLLGAFYRTAQAGGTWISSSAAVLASLPGTPACKPDSRRLRHGFGIEWFTPPLSGYVGIRRLLPSQQMDIRTGDISPKRLMPAIDGSQAYPELLAKLQSILMTGVSNARRDGGGLWIQLTAGLDSRLLLAAMVASGETGKAVTLDHRWISQADLDLPPKLAAAAGLPHTLVRRGRFSTRLAREYDEHTGLHHPEADREFYARQQFNWVRKDDVVLRGGCFHLARCHYWDLFAKGERPDKAAFASAFVESEESSGVAGLCEWFDWTTRNPEAGLDWRDRLYLEQRLGGWLSSDEQALDLCGFESHNPINSAEALSLLLSIPLEIRRSGEHHAHLIDRMAPQLMEFPFNPPDFWHRQWAQWGMRMVPRLVDPRYTARLIKRKVARLRGK